MGDLFVVVVVVLKSDMVVIINGIKLIKNGEVKNGDVVKNGEINGIFEFKLGKEMLVVESVDKVVECINELKFWV